MRRLLTSRLMEAGLTPSACAQSLVSTRGEGFGEGGSRGLTRVRGAKACRLGEHGVTASEDFVRVCFEGIGESLAFGMLRY
jgi:hypothetical protein